MKINLKDCTFLIQVQLDSVDRLVNVLSVLKFIKQNFNTNIHILEAGPFDNKLLSQLIPSEVKYKFIRDRDPVYYRTLYINKMVRECDTPYLTVWETDIIVPPCQVLQSIELIRSQQADFVSPYEKNALDTSKIIRELFLEDGDWKILEKHQKKMEKMYPPNPVGGAFFANREKYIESGLENLKFYGWGVEDGERVTRWKVLEYEYKRIPGNLYHLTHGRGNNSTFHGERQREKKIVELNNIHQSTKEELLEKTSRWEY